MKKNLKKQKRKQQIISLAEDAKLKINLNKILSEQIDNYNIHIQMIKTFMNKFSQNKKLTENISNENKNKYIKSEFIGYHQQLKKFVSDLRESTKKVKKKFQTNNDIFFDDISGDNLSYKQIHLDSFILSYSLEQKLNIIKRLKESIHFSKDYNIFREPKRETLINIRYGEDFIDEINQEYQRYALYEFKQFNKYYNKCQKKLKKINNYKNKIQIYNQIINYFDQVNSEKTNDNNKKKNNIKNGMYSYKNNIIAKSIKLENKKNYKLENDYNLYNSINLINYNSMNNDDFGYNLADLNNYETDETFNLGNINNNNLFPLTNSNRNRIKEKQKKNSKINFQTVEELFDLSNNEGEKEAIIDDELHSDDEIIFEKKIKSKKKIIIDYLPKIKREVPNLYLSQIEFNKSKVMNEADLYSCQRRQYQMQNVDENIKMMKKKLKIIKRRCKINNQKCENFKNYIKECEENYKSLKNIKVQISMKQEKVHFMKNEFYTQHIKDVIDEEDELNYQKEMDDYLNDPELNDPYFEQYQNLPTDITHRQTENNNDMFKKINQNIQNIDNNKKKYDNTRTHRDSKKEKVKRANSK